MPIVWRDEMRLGIIEVDNQHRYLICLINAIEAAVNCRLDKELFMTHIYQLEAYTFFHFEKEEELQIRTNIRI